MPDIADEPDSTVCIILYNYVYNIISIILYMYMLLGSHYNVLSTMIIHIVMCSLTAANIIHC